MDNASSLVRGHQPHLLSGFHCTSHCTPRSGLRHLGVRDQRLMSRRCVHRFKPGNRTAPLRQSRRIGASDEGLSGAHPSPRQAEVSEADLVDRVGRLGEGELLAVRTRQLVDKSLAGRIVIGVGDPSAMSAKPFTAHGSRSARSTTSSTLSATPDSANPESSGSETVSEPSTSS